ncbi:MAG: ABC transporter substrate-binding protein [Treponema sp.]|jgi:iron(III) transport system substrate-binding protein|nr:ABC transporter substrate-binding protein [Treponema sp.]
MQKRNIRVIKPFTIGIGVLTAFTVGFIFSSLGCKKATQSSQDPRGKIVIYTSMYEDIITAIDTALEQEFPNCMIEFVYGGTGTIQAKVTAEQKTGKLGCDMLMVAEPSYSLELKEHHLLYPYLSKQVAHLDFKSDPEGYWVPVRISNMVLAYNPEYTDRASIPATFYDFAFNENLRGLISMTNPLTSGTALAAVTALRDVYGYQYFEALGRQQVTVEASSTALAKLEAGEYQAIMVLEESVLKKQEEEGSKVEVIYPQDGTIIVPSTIMTINETWSANHNIAAAEAITDWFLSEEGQANIVAGWMHSVRQNFPTLPYHALPTSQIKAVSMPVDWVTCYRYREEIRTQFTQALKGE